MKAVIIDGPGAVRVAVAADPVAREDEVVVAIKACGVCATDLHIAAGAFIASYPVIPGHEFAGDVIEVGRGVSDVRVGDGVAVDPSLFCGRCYFCRSNMGNHCVDWNGIGTTRPGGFAEFVAVPARNVYPLDALDHRQGAFVEPLACVVYGMRRLQPRAGDDVLVLGAGPIGLLLVQAIRRSGSGRIAVADRRADRLAVAAMLGADLTVTAGVEGVRELRDAAPYGFDVIVDATGVAAAVEEHLALAKPGGKILLFGVCAPDDRMSLSPFEVYRKDLTIIGSFALCYTFNPALTLLKSGAIDVRPLLTHTFALDQAAEAFDVVRSGSGSLKVQIAPR